MSARRADAVSAPKPAPPTVAPSARFDAIAPAPIDAFAPALITWQRRAGRHDLPWQGTRDPYRVWLSEVMLQQTQVSTVLAYYPRFLARFPELRALAAAPLDDVLAAWSGLGYYRRARLLHRGAQTVVAEHGGVFPSRSDVIATLPGIGRSTAAAIAAFCFGERAAILDGNVKRVLARVLAFDGDLAQAKPLATLWQHAEALLPAKGDGIEAYTQGLMDLGATVCTPRRPQCGACPLAALCRARAQGEPERYPRKSKKAGVRVARSSVWLWFAHRDRVLLVPRPSEGVWASLWSLPEFADFDALAHATHGWPGRGEPLPSIRHVLTHFDWLLHPRRWTLPDDVDAAPFVERLVLPTRARWVRLDDALQLALPTPWRRLFGAARRA